MDSPGPLCMYSCLVCEHWLRLVETEISETFSVHTMLAIQPQTQLTPDPSRQRGLIHQQLLTLICYLETLQSDLMEGLTGRQAQNEGSCQCKWTDRDVQLHTNVVYRTAAHPHSARWYHTP